MMRAALAALVSHWRRAPFQLVTLLIGLATATALWSGVQAINAEARASYARAAGRLAGPPLPRIVAEDLATADYVTLRRAGWLVTPLLEGRLDLPGGPVALIGIDPFTLPPQAAPAPDAFDRLDAGILGSAGALLAAPGTARRLTRAGHLARPVEGLPENTAYADLPAAQALLGRPGALTALLVLERQPMTRPPLDRLDPRLRLTAPASGGDLDRLTDSFHLNLTAFGLLSFAVGLFIVRGAVGLAFEQRRGVFRTLRALGLPAPRLLALLTGELLALALVAGGLGILLGWLIAAALLPGVAATLGGLYGAEVPGGLTLRPSWWLGGLAVATIGTGLAGADQLWKVARLPLLAPAQPRAWARASERALRLQGGAALALAVLAGAAILWGQGLTAGFVALGAMLVGAALALPLVLHAVLGLGAARARGPLAEWFWADTRQQLPGLSLALMALLLALATNIGVGTMVQSFRTTFTGWLDQRLASELYVRARDPAEATRLAAWLAPRTEAVLPIFRAEARIAGLPGEIYGVADHATYRDNWPLIAARGDVWDRVAAGRAVLINEQLARREGIWPGDAVDVAGLRLPVAGVYSDYGNPLGQMLMGQALFDARFPGAERLRFGLRVAPGAVPGLARALRDEFGLPADRIVDQAALKRLSLGIFERTFLVTAALNVLTLGVAGLAILTALLTLGAMRLPQLAPVWALGLTRGRLARIELLRAGLLATLTWAMSIPVGLALAWVLLAVVNVEAFGWRLPMQLFPRDWLLLGLLSLAAAASAALLPARRLARTPPATLLKVFANER